MDKNIGFKIKKLREKRALSQENLAIKLGISQGALCKIENGLVEKIDFVLMDSICKLLKVELQYLMNDSSVHPNQNNKIDTFINSHYSENIIEKILNNQNQISQLLEKQNRLIEKLIENG